MKLSELFSPKTNAPIADNQFNYLRAEMQKHGYHNVKDFSDAIGWNYSTLWSKLSGRRPWTLKEARDISRFFHRSIEYVFYGEE